MLLTGNPCDHYALFRRMLKEVLYTAASYTLMAFRTETGFVSEND